MMICEHCGYSFEDDEAIRFHSGGRNWYESESWVGCPACSSDEITWATECGICGQYCKEEEPFLCEDCKKAVDEHIAKIKKAISELAAEMMTDISNGNEEIEDYIKEKINDMEVII